MSALFVCLAVYLVGVIVIPVAYGASGYDPDEIDMVGVFSWPLLLIVLLARFGRYMSGER